MTMFKLSRYYRTESLIHDVNPFLKLFITIVFIISVFVAKSTLAYLFLFAFLLIIMIASNVPAIEYLKSIWFTRFFIILLIIMDLIFFRSFVHMIWTVIPMIMIILMTSVLIFTTKVHDLMMTFEILLTPLKIFGINPRKVAFSIMLAIRFIPILLSESKNIIKAMKNRNPKEKETLKDKVRNTTNIMTPLMGKSVDHADRLADVMTVRNYSFDKKKKYIMYTRRVDYVIVSVQILLFIAILMKG